MTTTVKATYANGVLTPLEPLDLEQVTVAIEARPPSEGATSVLELIDELHEAHRISAGTICQPTWRSTTSTISTAIRRTASVSDVFADSGYWIALLDSRDRLHARARAITETLGTRRIVTTHMVLAEG